MWTTKWIPVFIFLLAFENSTIVQISTTSANKNTQQEPKMSCEPFPECEIELLESQGE